jgi:E3 ubiquitin-protein ligase SHPRH
LWFRSKEPDSALESPPSCCEQNTHYDIARHVIFSNWSDSLNSMFSHSAVTVAEWARLVVIRALKLNGIKFISFDQGKAHKDVVEKFIEDRTITVFLLHAERER